MASGIGLFGACKLVPVDKETAETENSGDSPGEASKGATGATTGAATADKGETGEKEADEKSTPDDDSGSETKPKGNGDKGEVDKGPWADIGKCEAGDERACFMYPDGDPIIYPGGVPTGSCVPGVQACKDGKWAQCIGAVAPKKMDTCEPGNDDNCDGKPNDHCKCVAGAVQDCGTDVGACEFGKMTCTEKGFWGECEGGKGPEAEICDGKIDHDCDGNPDSKDDDCDCINGSTDKPCGSNKGVCRPGHYLCEDGKWGNTCIGEVKPSKEICDGRFDEDCDGLPDNKDPDCECVDDGKPYSCDVAGTGDCGLGVKFCRDGKWSSCEPRFSRTMEICGKQRGKYGEGMGDEDCDGKIDETDSGNRYMPEGGVLYMKDDDRDGWGAKGDDSVRRYCKRNEASVPYNFRKAINGRVEQDCGDCDANVFPGAGYQESSSNCLAGLGLPAYDYDCNGVNEKQFKQQATGCVVRAGKCVPQGTWSEEVVPACGDKGKKLTCSFAEDGECNGVTPLYEKYPQPCK